MIAGALLVSVVLATLWALRRTPTDPRAGWSTSAGVPIWFEHSRSGARFMATESAGQIVIGAAADCPVPGTRPRHAQVRIFARDRIDIGPIDGAPVRVAGRRRARGRRTRGRALTPLSFVALCGLVAPLHAAGVAHDGRDAVTGRSFGGSTTRHRSECLVCGDVEVRIERKPYR